MNRRKLLQLAALTTALPITYVAGQSIPGSDHITNKELYELRTYELKFGGNRNLLISYLKDVLQPALLRVGVNHFRLFSELGKSDPAKLRAVISYPNSEVYMQAQNLNSDQEYVKDSESYHSVSLEDKIYNRFSSFLLLAFETMPEFVQPQDENTLFELRIYEGYSEDAVRRKIKMFNEEEILLFQKTNLVPLFFGDMISGPYRPCLVYMLSFKDMAERDATWEKFLNHPEWIAMRSKAEYANTVSNIRKIFLEPV